MRTRPSHTWPPSNETPVEAAASGLCRSDHLGEALDSPQSWEELGT